MAQRTGADQAPQGGWSRISILGAVHAFTDADDSDALTLMRAPRNEVLRPG